MNAPNQAPSARRRHASTAFRFAIVAGCVGYVAWGLDLGAVGATLARYDLGAVGMMVLVSFAAYSFLGVRLRILIGRRLAIGSGIAASLLALGVNNVLPAKLGELAKVIYLRERAGGQTGAMLGVVFWERFADVNALVVVGVATLLLVRGDLPVWPLVAIVAVTWLALASLRFWWALAERWIRLAPFERLVRLALDLGAFLRGGLSPVVFAGLVLTTAIVWTLYAAQSILAVLWVAALPLGLGQALVVFVVAALGIAAPSTPGGLGVFEAAVVLSLGWFGVSKEEALGVGIVMRVVQFVPTTLAAGVVLARSGLSLRALGRSAPSDGPELRGTDP